MDRYGDENYVNTENANKQHFSIMALNIHFRHEK